MPVTCRRCGKNSDPPSPARVGFPEVRERILGSICGDCWREWEAMELKVLNEYRLSFMDPQHREKLQQVCLEFLGLG